MRHLYFTMSTNYWKNVCLQVANTFIWTNMLLDDDEKYKEALMNVSKIENEQYVEDTNNLVRLMKVRQFLWT